jgi:hypothetical protein
MSALEKLIFSTPHSANISCKKLHGIEGGEDDLHDMAKAVFTRTNLNLAELGFPLAVMKKRQG